LKILLTGGKSAVALKLLKAFTNHKVVLADYGDVPLFATKDYEIISLGIKNEDVLAHTILNNCLNEGVDAILPIHSFEMEALAKAEVLFSEFNISLLLPNAFELNEYFKPSEVRKAEHWAIFNKGELIFSNQDDQRTAELGRDKNLSGAFYINPNNEFTLLAI
jgi:hypothetical protein